MQDSIEYFAAVVPDLAMKGSSEDLKDKREKMRLLYDIMFVPSDFSLILPYVVKLCVL